jgi:hypothetical protein
MAESNDFYDDSMFEEEAEKAVIEVDNEPLLDADSDEDGDYEEGETKQDSEFYKMTGKLIISSFDSILATLASIASGEPVEKYYQYRDKKTGKIDPNNDMVLAMAMVAEKNKWTMGPEVLLGIGLTSSTAVVSKMAYDDFQRKKRKNVESEKNI